MTAPEVGDACPERGYAHSPVQLFRFSAVSWNAHRIHYDAGFAASEGFPGVVVQSTLHGETVSRHALDWAGPGARLESVAWRNVATAVAGERLTWTATVAAVEGPRVRLAVRVLKEDGSECVTGTVELT
ncbi:acyl dehydratase, partial [Streptomyces sp. NPDC002920]